ncbi:MAG: adenylate/guanylate cyclase domain-containing protein, partial [Alphaproteobacteria bacterium]
MATQISERADASVAKPKSRFFASITSPFRQSDLAHLPARVTQQIIRREDEGEVLVRIIQLGIVTIFGLLYFAGRKTDLNTAFALAPYVLGFYFVVTIVGLVWSLRGHLPDWAVYGSSVIDIAILLVLIWSFHLQYDQPASFYLKAPTLLYVFIFITLRALRFRARFVIVTGLTAALGWLAMVAYAIRVDPQDNMITRDYIDYLTGNEVLIGAEIDKIVSILAVTLVLALVLRRARIALVQAVTERTAAHDLSRFFDSSVADTIRSAEEETAAGSGVLRQASVINVDIRGFTDMAAAVPPSEVIKMLTDYQARLVPLIQSAGGTIDKFLGDGIMATFGAVDPVKDHAARALRALDAVLAESERWSQHRTEQGHAPLAVNAAVVAGPVVFGA